MPIGPPTITRVVALADALAVWFDDDDPVRIPWKWVRDHSEDPSALDPVTRQRLVDTFLIPDGLTATAATIGPAGVTVEWPDSTPDSELSCGLLAAVAGRSPSANTTWDASSRPDPLPAVDHDDVMTSDRGLLGLLDPLDRLGFVLVRGLPPTRRDARTLAERIAPPRRTIFGDMWHLAPGLTEHADSAYDRTFLAPHTDGTYSHDAPGLQMFACLDRDGTGGESILVDGFAAADRLRTSSPPHFELLTTVAVPGRYVEPGVHLEAARPTIGLDHTGRVRQITLNNYDRAPFLLPPEELARWYDAYEHVHRIVGEREHWLEIRLEPGDVLLFDNWRVLHGRNAYTGRRVFEGCYHDREDFERRLRELRSPAEAVADEVPTTGQ